MISIYDIKNTERPIKTIVLLLFWLLMPIIFDKRLLFRKVGGVYLVFGNGINYK